MPAAKSFPEVTLAARAFRLEARSIHQHEETKHDKEVGMGGRVVVMFAMGLTLAGASLAQATTSATVNARKFEVISVDGDQLVVRDERARARSRCRTVFVSRWTASSWLSAT
jgi:hypothetical protein